MRTREPRPFIILFLLALACTPPGARAALPNNVETFDGTTKDVTVWGEAGGAWTQDDRLIYSGTNSLASYNTRAPAVIWGQGVRVKMRSTQTAGGVAVFLTNNSVGPDALAAYNSAYWSFDLQTFSNPAINRFVIGHGTSGGWGFTNLSAVPQPNVDYFFQIDPLSTGSARFTLFNSAMQMLESRLYTQAAVQVPNNLYISLTGAFGSGEFDDLAVVPEPGATAALIVGLGCAVLARRRAAARAGYSNRSNKIAPRVM